MSQEKEENNGRKIKTIRIYLAMGNDLYNEYYEIAEMIDHLNKALKPRNIEIERVVHDEDKELIDSCDVRLTLYHTDFGNYGVEHFDDANTALKNPDINPKKVYVFFKSADKVAPELQKFIENFVKNYGHFFDKFQDVSAMKYQFLMQLELYNGGWGNRIISAKNQYIMVGDEKFVNFNDLSFAQVNKDYIELRNEISSLAKEIETLRLVLKTTPNNIEIETMIEDKLQTKNKKEEKFKELQDSLLNVSLRIAKIQGERISERKQRAINAFKEGDVNKAKIILDEAVHYGKKNFEKYMATKELLSEERGNVILSIEEVQFQIEATLAEVNVDIEFRKKEVLELYAQITTWAKEVEYDIEKYVNLLFEYADFLYKYAFYDEALPIAKEALELSTKEYGKEHEYTASSCNNVGVVYSSQGKYDMALENYNKALAIYLKVFDKEHADTASNYNNIGNVYYSQDEYDIALENHERALAIKLKVLDEEHADTASSYNNIGNVYYSQGKYDMALENYNKALTIYEKALPKGHPSIEKVQKNIKIIKKKMNASSNHKQENFFTKLKKRLFS